MVFADEENVPRFTQRARARVKAKTLGTDQWCLA